MTINTASNTASPEHYSAALRGVVNFYETISPASIAKINTIYAADAYFKDPFNEVTGVKKIEAIFTHMFVQVAQPKFKVISAQLGADHVPTQEAFIVWLFDWGKAVPIRGSSHLKFDANGLVTFHRDYWDAAEELYETLPVLGSVMRLLKRRLTSH